MTDMWVNDGSCDVTQYLVLSGFCSVSYCCSAFVFSCTEQQFVQGAGRLPVPEALLAIVYLLVSFLGARGADVPRQVLWLLFTGRVVVVETGGPAADVEAPVGEVDEGADVETGREYRHVEPDAVRGIFFAHALVDVHA